ncbi:ATP-binding protein [Chloroflexota bacterium]
MNYLYVLPPLVAFVFCSVLVYAVLRSSTRSRPHQLFLAYLVAIALWGLVLFGMRNSPDVEYALAWDRAVMGFSALIVLLLYHFTVAYTGVVLKQWLLPTAYISLALIIALSPTSLLIPQMQMKPYGYAPVPGLLFPLALLIEYIWSVLAIVNLLLAYKKAKRYILKNRYLYILVGFLAMALGAAFDFLPLLGLPVYPGSIIGAIIFCLLTTIAIVRYALLDIRIIVRKGTAYITMSSLTALLYAGAVILINRFLEERVERFVTYFVLLVLGIVLLQPLWQRMQRLVDWWFYGNRYSHLNTLQQLMNKTYSLEDLPPFIASIKDLLCAALQASRCHLLLLSSSGYSDTIEPRGEKITITLGSNHPLITWFEKHGKLLRINELASIPQLQTLTVKQINQLEALEGILYVPVKTNHGRLVAMITMGEKKRHRTYTLEEEEILTSAASRLAVNLENSYLYSEERSLREQVERQDEKKTEFLHSVAHELKTPLTAILSSSELLGEDLSTSTAMNKRLISNIQQSASSMNSKVSELLDLATMQIGEPPIKLEPLSIGKVITKVEQQLRIIFENMRQTLILEVPKSLPRVNADREKLEQVLFNLLSNANKYSPAGSEIALRARRKDTKVIIEIEDSGPIINEAERTKIFDPYYRGKDADKRTQVPGLGLGLAISKNWWNYTKEKFGLKANRQRETSLPFPCQSRARKRMKLSKSFCGYSQDRR